MKKTKCEHKKLYFFIYGYRLNINNKQKNNINYSKINITD